MLTSTMAGGITADSRKNTHESFNSHLPSKSNHPHVTTEAAIVKSILQVFQGLSTPFFFWNKSLQSFSPNPSLHLSHLSPSTLSSVLSPLLHAATSLHLVRALLHRLNSIPSPLTLTAFSSSVSSWVQKLHSIALHEEQRISMAESSSPPTILSLSFSISHLFSSAHHLLDVMLDAIPVDFLNREHTENSSLSFSFVSAHVVDILYCRINRVCLLGCDGEVDGDYHMLLFLFVGTVIPYIHMLDSWLFQGILDDPFEEMFFSADMSVLVENPLFWERGYIMRSPHDSTEGCVVPCFLKGVAGSLVSAGKSLQLIRHGDRCRYDSSGRKNGVVEEEKAPGLTFSEVFLVSLMALIGEGDRLFRFIKPCDCEILLRGMEKPWKRFLNSAISRKEKEQGRSLLSSIWPLNPAISLCRGVLEEEEKKSVRNSLNLSCNFTLLPLNDEELRRGVFGEGEIKGTDYNYGFRSDCHGYLQPDDTKLLAQLLPFPTLLPTLDDDFNMADVMPFQRNSTLSSTLLTWIKENIPKRTPLPLVLTEECLLVYIKGEVESIGRDILQKLMNEWRLMETLRTLRAIYLLGSGDLLHHFFNTVFRKLDRGEPWEDDFELNTILQESIRNSSDWDMMISSPESLVVFIRRKQSGGSVFGTEVGFECLKFDYKVPWPLEIIVTEKASEKYEGVMEFLMKVKRAKYVLDKCRRLIWRRGRGPATMEVKGRRKGKMQWLVEQKLLHFVDVFHQYVMERVYHSAWCELCEGVRVAGSLDEVVRVHESYLLSIQRQCFLGHDKLGALIATRINCILRLAVEFYSVIRSGGYGSSTSSSAYMKAEMEAGRVEKQFDDCVAFLLRVLSLKLNMGNLPHLANLVTRLNYNYYYMSESGTLIVTPDTSNTDRKSRN